MKVIALAPALLVACGMAPIDEPEQLGRTQRATLRGETPGYVTMTASDDANACVNDPVEDIESDLIADPSYIVTYNSGVITDCGDDTDIAPYIDDDEEADPPDFHRQSIQRLYRDDENWLLVSQSVCREECRNKPGTMNFWRAGFEVIRMNAHVGPGDLGSAGLTPTSDFPGAPKCGDRILNYFEFPVDVPTDATHAGGLQVNGRYVAVPFEDPDDGPDAGFMTVDLDDPLSPVAGPVVNRVDGEVTDAGAAALTRTDDEHFLVMVFGNDAAEGEVFVSAGTTMPTDEADWDPMGAFSCPFGAVIFGSCVSPHYQNVQFVTACSEEVYGELYVVATDKDGSGDDVAGLWKVTFVDGQHPYAPSFEAVTSQTMICSSTNTASERFCDFDAGAGPYVDPDNELILYGVEHYNDFPLDGTPANRGIKVREFP